MSIQKSSHGDVARGAQERTGPYALSRRLRVKGSISDAQLKELQRVAEKCPVHKLMTPPLPPASSACHRVRAEGTRIAKHSLRVLPSR